MSDEEGEPEELEEPEEEEDEEAEENEEGSEEEEGGEEQSEGDEEADGEENDGEDGEEEEDSEERENNEEAREDEEADEDSSAEINVVVSGGSEHHTTAILSSLEDAIRTASEEQVRDLLILICKSSTTARELALLELNLKSEKMGKLAKLKAGLFHH